MSEMGSRVIRERPANVPIGALPTSKKSQSSYTKGDSGILTGSVYRPRTKDTAVAWEYILSFVQGLLGGEQPRDVLASAAEECLLIMKNEHLKDLDRKEKVEASLFCGELSMDAFAQLVNLCRKVTDFSSGEVAQNTVPEEDDGGVAVVFEEEEEEENGGSNILGDGEEEDDYVPEGAIPIIRQQEEFTEETFKEDELVMNDGFPSEVLEESELQVLDLDSLAFTQGLSFL